MQNEPFTCSKKSHVACSSELRTSLLITAEVTDVHVRPFQTSRIVLGLTPYIAANRVLVLLFLFVFFVVGVDGLNTAK